MFQHLLYCGTIWVHGPSDVDHVHADDVAQGFQRALENWSAAVGESFHVVSPRALTLRGYAEAVAGWFGRDADLTYLPFDEWTDRPEYDEEDEKVGTSRHVLTSSFGRQVMNP